MNMGKLLSSLLAMLKPVLIAKGVELVEKGIDKGIDKLSKPKPNT